MRRDYSEWVRWGATIIALGISLHASNDAHNAVEDQEAARKERVAQLCQVFTKEYKNDVNELHDLRRQQRETLEFLAKVKSTPEGDSELVRVVRAQQPEKLHDIEQSRQEAIDSRPPEFCGDQQRA